MMELAIKTITADRPIGSQRAARETMDSLLEREGECRNSQATLRCLEVEVKGTPGAFRHPPLLDTPLLRPLSLNFAPRRSYASGRASPFLRGIKLGERESRCSSKSKIWNSIPSILRRSIAQALSIWGRIFSKALHCMLPGERN